MTATKTKKVTFDTALPRGTCATFTHEGVRWIAYPQEKNTAINTMLDRLLAVLDRVRDDLIQWMNAYPDDADRLCRILVRVNRAQELREELAEDKCKAVTM